LTAHTDPKGIVMALYIKTEDYHEHGISKTPDLEQVRAVVRKELNLEEVFVSFVNQHEFIRVDFLRPRPSRKARRRGFTRSRSQSQQQA
jgi:hypothetical protein